MSRGAHLVWIHWASPWGSSAGEKTGVVHKGLWHPLPVLIGMILHILLQTIDRLKAAAAPLVQAERDAAALAALSAPRICRLADGRSVEVALPETLRARELAAAHAVLAAADGSNLDARLAALLAAKYHAKAVDCRCGWRAGCWCWCAGWRSQGWVSQLCCGGCWWEAGAWVLTSCLPPHTCSLTREIVALVDREADLLNRLVGG